MSDILYDIRVDCPCEGEATLDLASGRAEIPKILMHEANFPVIYGGWKQAGSPDEGFYRRGQI